MTVAAATQHRYAAQVMGLPISLALRGRHAGGVRAEEAWTQVVASLREVDRVFSTYRPDSWMSRLARGEVDVADAPPEVTEALGLAEQARTESGGAFDIRWHDADGRPVLDPSGLVKGWALERAARVLLDLPDTDHCLGGGGDLVCHVAGPDSPVWRIGIEDPHDPTRLVAGVPLRSGAVATSGTAHRGEHIVDPRVDPRTGATPRTFASVTVVADRLLWADVDATAAFVLGEDAPSWLAGRGRRGVLVWADGRVETYGASS